MSSLPARLRTVADVLADQQRQDGGRPFVTYYDDATGERIELSVTTFATWVAKTAGLVQDDLQLERGALVVIDLPTHWLSPVWLVGAWTAGLEVSLDPADAPEADLLVVGPAGLHDIDVRDPAGAPVVALSLRPLGARFAEALPEPVTDFGAVIWSQPDVFVPYEPPEPDDPALRTPMGTRTQADLVSTQTPPERVLTDLSPTSYDGVDALVGALASGGSVVWVAHPDADGWERRAATERASLTLRGRTG